MKTYSMTDIGSGRELNEDYFFSSETPVGKLPNLFIVADGMGGYNAGEYASRYTIERVVASVIRNQSDEPVSVISEAIKKANEILIDEARGDSDKYGMGTTLVVATIIGKKLIVANVGDSRLYIISDHIRQVTRDHSWVEELVRRGEVEEKDARKHPQKNVITRAVGATDKVEPDFFEVELGTEDLVLLCSDGLTNMIEDMDIERIIKERSTVEERVKALVEIANENGGKDNITAIMIQPFSDEVKEC